MMSDAHAIQPHITKGFREKSMTLPIHVHLATTVSAPQPEVLLNMRLRLTPEGRMDTRGDETYPSDNLVECLEPFVPFTNAQTDNIPSDTQCHDKGNLDHGD